MFRTHQHRFGAAAAALTVTAAASTGTFCPTDVNQDGTTGIDDLIAVILDWGTDGAAHEGDVNADGIVTIDDVIEIILGWGSGPCVDGLSIEFWYGTNQSFGAPGRPQEQVNVLGNVPSEHGLDELSFTLNGGPSRSLSFGPDTRRLASPGDFNIELFYPELQAGTNTIVVEATDLTGQTVQQSMTLQLAPPLTWPLPYAVSWPDVPDLAQAVDVVDGVWAKTPAGLRCTEPDYDRLVALGDLAWTDYEITVPVTIHAVDETGYEFPSILPAVGFVFRWPGHSDNFDPGAQPNQGWWPFGAVTQYSFRLTGCGGRFEMYGNPFVLRDEDQACGLQPAFGETWIWKMRVETNVKDGTSIYRFKAWPQDDPEPAPWLLASIESPQELGQGCLLLLAHHVDVTFGDIVVVVVGVE